MIKKQSVIIRKGKTKKPAQKCTGFDVYRLQVLVKELC